MKTPALFFLPFALFSTLLVARAHAEDPKYPLTEDSKAHPEVPRGELIKFDFAESKIFPGTTRAVIVYVPRQYDATKPACVYVNQDGLQWNANVVFDNLIARGEMPVTIGVFVMHGRVKALDGEHALDRFNRSLEYDGLGPDYARFLLTELLPAVEQKTTQDGRKIILSQSGNDRAIGGSSSGAICAFNAAWEKPEAFSRVFSAIGTFVSLRGADRFPGLIRKTEPKALRVFQQDGANDLNIYGGDWFFANQMMQRALEFAGYESMHVWGEGAHSGAQGSALFPDAMRFLWKGWPEPVKAGVSKNHVLTEIFSPEEKWQIAWEGGKLTEGLAVNSKGEVFFNDVPNSKTYKIALDGKVSEFVADSRRGDGQAFGPDGRLYAVAGADEKVLAYDEKAQPKEVASGFRGNDLVVLSNGNLYATEPGWDGTKPSKVWLIKPDGAKQVVDSGLKFSNGITASPDQSLLYVADSRSHWIYSYQIQLDGTLLDKQRYFWMHSPDDADDANADGLKVDEAGRLYAATRLGLQIADQAGRVNVIAPTPNGRASNLVFGGADFDTLFVSAGDKIYRRKTHTHGVRPYQAPIKPKPPGL